MASIRQTSSRSDGESSLRPGRMPGLERRSALGERLQIAPTSCAEESANQADEGHLLPVSEEWSSQATGC